MTTLVARLAGLTLLGAALQSGAAEVNVMTQNQYLGADLTPVLAAATAVPFDPAVFGLAVETALRTIAGTRPAERARALAAQIEQRAPDVVGLQEAYQFVCYPYPGYPTLPGLGCDDPDIKGAFTDHLQDTVAALKGRYTLAGRVTNMNIPALPFAAKGYPALLGVIDRDAILVKSGVPMSPVDLPGLTGCTASDQGCNFAYPPTFDTPMGPIAVARGYLAVDITVQGMALRVFNTHLEQRLLAPDLPQTRLVQSLQALELKTAAEASWHATRKLVVLGDFNSARGDVIPVPPYPPTLPGTAVPTATPYQLMTQILHDAALLPPRVVEDLTCCQDERLDNRESKLYERIDHLFVQGPVRAVSLKRLGATMGDKTRPPGHGGLWASDHAAVAAILIYGAP